MALSNEESQELDMLAFIVVADLPMTQAQVDRYAALKDKRDGPDLSAMPDWAWAEWVQEQGIGE